VGLWQAAGALGSIAGSLCFGLFLELFRTDHTNESYSHTGYTFAFSSAAALVCASAGVVRAIPAGLSVPEPTVTDHGSSAGNDA
jgi:MFS family permease